MNSSYKNNHRTENFVGLWSDSKSGLSDPRYMYPCPDLKYLLGYLRRIVMDLYLRTFSTRITSAKHLAIFYHLNNNAYNIIWQPTCLSKHLYTPQKCFSSLFQLQILKRPVSTTLPKNSYSPHFSKCANEKARRVYNNTLTWLVFWSLPLPVTHSDLASVLTWPTPCDTLWPG